MEILYKPNKKKIKEFVLDEVTLSEISRLSFLGLVPEQIADYFGLDWYDWFIKSNENPELKQAIKIGKSKGIVNASEKLLNHMESGDLKATTFFLETKGGFNKPDPKQEQPKDDAKEKANVTINCNDPIEASRIYQKIMQGD